MKAKLLNYSNGRPVMGAMILSVFLTGPGLAQAVSPKDNFYQAYYAEQADGDWARAAKLYSRVAKDPQADANLRKQADARLAVCREELVSADFTQLMPPNPIAYFEFSNPGKQLEKLLDQLGLLNNDNDTGNKKLEIGGRRVSISPRLIDGLLGIRGAAFAVTGVDLSKGKPTGVAVLHAGNMEVIRGLIETSLPISGTAAKPIGGYPTYDLQGQSLVTLTSRLVIVSPSRALIQGVVDRLTETAKHSLANNKELAAILDHRGDSLLFFCVNAKPIMPMINGLLAAASIKSREAGVARVILDPNSLKFLVGRLGVDDDGMSFDLALQLEEGHHNLVYNFLRTPPISKETLARVPKGAAAFIIGALNQAPLNHGDRPRHTEPQEPIVTALDFGREVFANVTSFVLFALPPEDGATPAGTPIPDLALTMTVHDTTRSRTLWSQVLGIASLASTGAPITGQAVRIAGADTTAYKMPNGLTLFFATQGSEAMIASSKSAMRRALHSKQKGQSILDDKAFADNLSLVTPSTTQAFFAHVGRLLQLASPFMPEEQRTNLEPVLPLLNSTVASLVVDHSEGEFHLGGNITGVPKIGGLVTQLVEQQMADQQKFAEVDRLLQRHEWAVASAKLDQMIEARPKDGRLLLKKFTSLASEKNKQGEALEYGEKILAHFANDANTLNTVAWRLLTEKQFRGSFNKLALKMSQRSNELTKQSQWMYVDTLALATFETGDVATAIDLEKKAMSLSGGNGMTAMKEALARFERAKGQNDKISLATGGGQ